MKNKISMLFLSLFSLHAAPNNPFINAKDINTSVIAPPGFEREEFNFPSDARIIRKVDITYIALDGSEKHLNLDINKSLDWHDTFVFTKAKSSQTLAILDVSVTKPEVSESNNSISVEIPLDSGKLNDVISFANYTNRIKLGTQDEMIGDFTIGNPSKIILDFKNSATYPTKTLDFDKGPFRKIVFGSHKDYYRIVIYLDGKYNYQIQKDASGYILHLL